MNINFKNLKIGSVSNTSGIFSGENLQVDWNYSKKSNEGFGTLSGNHNTSSNNKHLIKKHYLKTNKQGQKSD